MKRKLFILLFLFMIMFTHTAFSAPPAVVDEAGCLTSGEEAILADKLEQIREKYDFDVAIVIEDEMSYSSAQRTADNIYDYNGYGLGKNYDGMLLYLSTDSRDYAFTTHGYGMTAFNDNGLAYLEDEILPHLKDDEYYEAFTVYADLADELLQMAQDGDPYNKTKKNIVIPILILLFLPVIIAFILTKIKEGKMNTATAQNFAHNYIKQGSMDIKYARDIFLYSTVIKTKKPTSNSGSHTSSSGRTHGGRSGRF